MGVHVGGADGDIVADELGRVHVGVVGGVVAPVHPQHRRLHHLWRDDGVAAEDKNFEIITEI